MMSRSPNHRPSPDEDACLVDALRRGAPGAADALVAAYGSRIYRNVNRILINRADAEEVAQDVLHVGQAPGQTAHVGGGERGDQLGGVAGPLGPLAQLVQRRVVGPAAEAAGEADGPTVGPAQQATGRAGGSPVAVADRSRGRLNQLPRETMIIS